MATRILGTVGKAMYAVALGTIVSPEALLHVPVALVSHITTISSPATATAAPVAPTGSQPDAIRVGVDGGWITVGVARPSAGSHWTRSGPA